MSTGDTIYSKTGVALNIERLEKENAELRDSVKNFAYALEAMTRQCDKFKLLARQRWNDGLLQGRSDAKRCYEDAAKAKDEYLAENEKLTNMLLEVEAERDALRSRIDGGIRVYAAICAYSSTVHIARYPDSTNSTLILDEGVNLDA